MSNDFCNLDFASCETLASQLADNICRAIARGDFKTGDKLPSIAKMAKMCGTSVRVPREAIRLLEDEGVVKGRPRAGIVVLGKKRFVWRGSVLFVSYGRQAYYYRGVLFKNIAQRLSEKGWRVDFVSLVKGEKGARRQMEPLCRALQNGHAIVFGAHFDEATISEIRKAGVPYFAITSSVGADDEVAAGLATLSESEAIVELAEASAKAGVDRALRVVMDDADELFDVPFHSRGIATENLVVRPDAGIDRFENSSKFVFDRLVARLTDSKKPKVGLVYFGDDSFTEAGLWAIESAGLRVPDDIRVVTFSNCGNRPFYRLPLTCIAHDLLEHAERIGRGILAFLDGRKFPRLVTCSATFVQGATF